MILITGGAGFIGSNFIRHLLHNEKNLTVINVDKLTYAGNTDHIKDLMGESRHLFFKGDIGDSALIKDLFKRYEISIIINFAAETHVDRSIQEPDIFIKTNVIGTMTLLNEAKVAWEKGKDKEGYPSYQEEVRFIQISTDEVYGSMEGEKKAAETSAISPNNPYAASKASADLLINAYHKTYKLPVNIIRCCNNFGPAQHEEKLIPLMVTNALHDKKLPLYGDGLQRREWIYVEDACKAIHLIMKSGIDGETYNVGTSNEIKNLELIRFILKTLGKSETLIEFVSDRLGHDRRYAIDYQKIEKTLLYKPDWSFYPALEKTIGWYQKKWKEKNENRP